MNDDVRNQLLFQGSLDHPAFWPKTQEFLQHAKKFRWPLPFVKLPDQPVHLHVCGQRQLGKSTWLEMELQASARANGPGSAYFLNAQVIASPRDLERRIFELEAALSPAAKTRRIFVDDIDQVVGWVGAIKNLKDQGHLKELSLITTGGRISPETSAVFSPISFQEYYRENSGPQALCEYLLSGGVPAAIHSLHNDGVLNQSLLRSRVETIVHDFVGSGRRRQALLQLLNRLIRAEHQAISYTQLSREASLANNTSALDYAERLQSLFCVKALQPLDLATREVAPRRASRFLFTDLLSLWAFHPLAPRTVKSLQSIAKSKNMTLWSYLVAQELCRRACLQNNPGQPMFYWCQGNYNLDFIVDKDTMIKIKQGPSTAAEFAWFPKYFPGQRLTVLSDSCWETENAESMTLEQWLLAANCQSQG